MDEFELVVEFVLGCFVFVDDGSLIVLLSAAAVVGGGGVELLTVICLCRLMDGVGPVSHLDLVLPVVDVVDDDGFDVAVAVVDGGDDDLLSVFVGVVAAAVVAVDVELDGFDLTLLLLLADIILFY